MLSTIYYEIYSTLLQTLDTNVYLVQLFLDGLQDCKSNSLPPFPVLPVQMPKAFHTWLERVKIVSMAAWKCSED